MISALAIVRSLFHSFGTFSLLFGSICSHISISHMNLTFGKCLEFAICHVMVNLACIDSIDCIDCIELDHDHLS